MEHKNGKSLDEFREAAIALLPAIRNLRNVLDSHGLGSGTLYFGESGYFSISGRSFMGWELAQYDTDHKPEIKYEYRKELEINGEADANG